MAKEAAGLSFSNPFMEKTNVGEIPNPYAPYSPTSSIGLGGLGPSAADMAMVGESMVKQSQFTMPEMKRPPAIAFSSSENKMFVNGLTFGADDAATALQSESYLRGPGTQLPTGGDWVPLDEQAYGQYLSGIRNPGLGRLASKNFGRGVDVMQLLAGRGLQLAGAEETGGAIVESQMEDLRKTSPYERMATDVKSGSNAIDWFVANFAQQGPNLIESVLTAGAGFLAGTAAGGPLAGAGAALAGLMGKEAFKQSVIAAAKKKVAGEVLNAAEGKLLREAAGIAGAVATSYGQNFATGAADIYGELREQGADATDTDARLKALAGAVPYAALESLPEFLLATRLFGGVVSPRAIPAGASRLQRGVSYAGRAATGGAVGGTAEGLTETGQEGLLLGISGQDLSSPEAVDRLINSFAAGFGVGGPLGAVANLKGKAPANLLKPAENPDPTSTSLTVPPPTTPGTAVSPYYTPVTPMGPIAPPPAQLAGPPTVPQLPPPGQVLQVQGRPDFVVDSNGTVRQAMPEDVVVGVSGNIPGQQVNQQGVLDIFGGQPVTAGELAARMTPQGVPPLGYTPQAPQPSPQQGALQFAPPAPLPTSPVNPQMQNQLQIIQDQLRRQNEFAAAQQQREEQQAAEQDLIAQQSKNARDLYILQQQQQRQPPTTAMPMVPIQPRMPQQLSLFSRREAPVPSRAEGLRRGVGTQLPEPSVGTLPRKDLRRSTQVPMFTQQGQPSMPALKAAGVTSKLPAPKIEAGAKQIPPTGKPVTAVTVAKAKAAVVKKEAETKAGVEKLKAKEKADAVQKRGAEALLTRKRAEAGKRVGAEIPSKREVAGKGEALKAKAKSKDDEQRQAIQKQEVKKETPLKKPVAAPAVVAPVEEEFKPKTVAELEAEAAAARPAGAAVVEAEQTPTEILAEEIQTAETTTDINTFKEAIDTVVFHAFFDTDSNNVKAGLIERAQAFLNNTQFTESQRQSINQALLDVASGYMQLEATYTRGKNKDQEKAWFTYAVQRNLLPSIRAKLINLPAQYKTSVGPVSGKIATTKPIEGTTKRIFNTPEAMLGELISDLITQIRNAYGLDKPFKYNGQTFDNIVALAKDLYAQTTAAGKNYIVRGFPLKEYFKADGTPKTMKSGDRFLITNQEMTAAQQEQIEAEQKEALKALAAEDKAKALREFEREQLKRQGVKVEDDWDSDAGEFYRDDGSPVNTTIPAGRVSLLVRSFLSKLKIKPTVNIFRNVNDLKTRNPALYKRAAAARKEGDFDTTNAGGYSFGPNVIIFTDFIRTEQQLKFILAHETLGHFGMRGVVPKADLDRVLNSIYNSDSDVQAAVDAMVNNQGMSKLEAIEEYLADNAADLDVSIISRLWNVLKNFLNKLGFEFQDDEARYFVNQARKYVRRGDTGNFISAKSIALDVAGLDQAVTEGRYARMGFGKMASNSFAAGGLNYNTGFGATRGLRGAAEAFAKKAFGKHKDVPGMVASLLEQIQTLDNKARRSFGLSEIYRMLESQQQYARALLSKYQRMTSFTHSVDLGFLKKGVTEEEKEEAGKLLAHAALLKARSATDEFIKSFDSMIYQDAAGSLHIDHWVREEIEKAGRVTAEEFRKGFDIDYDDGAGNVVKQRFQMDVDEDSDAWKVYLEQREAVNKAAIDMMLSNYEAAQAEGDRIIGDVNKGRRAGNVFTTEDLQAIRKAAELYQNARYAGSDVANAGVELKNKSIQSSEDFLVAFGRALFDTNAFNDWVNKTGTATAFAGAEYDDLRAALPSLRAKIRSKEDSFVAQKAIRDLFLFDLQSKNAEYYAKRTILGSYVPFTRRGDQQVRIVAVDDKGNPVKLDENVRNVLPYFQFNSRSEADAAAADLELQFGDDDYTLLDENGNEVSVRFVAEISKVRQSPDLTETVNFNEFIYVLNRLNANIAPEVREKIITTLTSQNSRARKNLQRSGTPGWDKDVIRSVSEHLETTAHVAAKKLYRHRLDDVLLNDSNWLGDAAKLRALKDAVDNAQTDGQRARAQRAYDEYAFQYQYMAGSRPGGAKTVEIDGKQVPTLGRGEDYREDAKEVLRWYSETTNITDSTEDMLSGEVGSKLKLITVLMQLGGSVATAVINLASIATHSLPYLASYNPKRAFGGGYGFAKSSTALYEALNNVKNVKMADPAWLNNMVEVDKNWNDYGLTEDEAKFLFRQTEEGTLQAAQFNALVGTARGKVFDNRAQAAIKAWMSMFSYTEQMNRRATALAAYRLEKERALSQGISEAQAITEATEAARKAVNTSQGEYAMFNRPEMARGNVLQYVFVYKQFVLLTVQLLRNLPPKSQMLMLGFLLLAGGIKGLPFAEDIFDIVDTIAQKLGLKMASIEKEIAMWVDSVAPGMTPYVMRGVLDQMTGSTISSRMGMGDLIPLTGAFRAGADPAREVADFAGPVFSGIAGLVGTAGSLAKYGAEVIGLRDDTTSFNTILRESPVAAMRAVGDSLAYTQSGMITNVRGQVVAKEAGAHTIIARLLGFYPAIATQQNDIVRLSKYVSEYNKAIKADYVGAYVKAKMAGDTDRMQELSATVREWNEDAKGTGLEVKNFEKSANRAALEAGRPTALRYLKSAPKQMRPETIELLKAHGIYDEIN